MSAAPASFLTGGGPTPNRSDRPVFLSDFVHIAMRFEDLAPVLLDPKMAWLRRLDDPTAADQSRGGEEDQAPTIGDSGGAPSPSGEPALTESVMAEGAPPAPPPGVVSVLVWIGPARHPLQPVRVTAGPARRHSESVIVPIVWEPGRHERILPRLDADLELSYLDEPYARLGVSGRYRVPLAQFGAGLDRVGLHRVAESTLRRFLREAEAAIVAER